MRGARTPRNKYVRRWNSFCSFRFSGFDKDGVVKVELNWTHPNDSLGKSGEAAGPISNQQRMHRMPMGPEPQMHRFHSAQIREITPPRFDTGSRHGTVSLISDLNDDDGKAIGQLDVRGDFTFIFRHVIESGWWQSTKAFLVDDSGQILFIGTDGVSDTRNPAGERFGVDRVIGLLLKWSSLSSAEIADRIIASLAQFRGSAKQEDDVTLVVAKAYRSV